MKKVLDIAAIAQRAKQAARELAVASGTARAAALSAMAEQLEAVREELLAANAADMAAARKKGVGEAFLHRLEITDKIFAYMKKRLVEAAALPDPVGRILEGRTMPSGLRVSKVAVPLGVVAIIYEARPNVTTDAAAVALKSANAVILRGGSECLCTNRVLVKAMRQAIRGAGLTEEAVQFIDSPSHEAVQELLSRDAEIDVVIPRGGKSLIQAIAQGTRIPVLKHYDGICHLYVSEAADLKKAVEIVVNSKTQRVEVCNALETLLVNRRVAKKFLPALARALKACHVELRGCAQTREVLPDAKPATDADWDTEYLAPILSIRVVDDLSAAMEHIARHGSGHTDGIITQNLAEARAFAAGVDSASIMINASTRLSGGGDYGMGAVVGISTGKLHARGPVGPAELCSYKWIAEGDGHLRD